MNDNPNQESVSDSDQKVLQEAINQEAQWDNLIKMQIYLKHIKGTTTFAQIVDNSFAEKAMKAA